MQSLKSRALIGIGVFTLLLAGCSPLFGQGQTTITSLNTTLSNNQTVGQTLTSFQGGLAGLDIYLAPKQPGSGNIILSLRSTVNSKTDITYASLPITIITKPGFYHFSFPPLSNSYLTDYYVILKVTGSGTLNVGSTEGDAYLDGALYINNKPIDAQMAFRPFYAVKLASLAIAKQALNWLWQFILAILLFIIPGWALLSGFWPRWPELTIGEKLGLSAGLSVAIYPILLLWTNVVGLQLGPLYAWLPVGLACCFLVWKSRATIIRVFLKILRRDITFKKEGLSVQSLLPDLGLLVIMAMIIATRLWVARTLVIPMWGDSYQHTMMAQLLVDHNGLFNSWLPYADLLSFTYHFGFHATVAVYHWLSGLAVTSSTIMVGQWFNVLAILALYPLAYRLTHQKWVGTMAVLISGLLLSIPMVYINWGRYTQLAGQLVMPVAIYLAWEALDQPRLSWRAVGLAGITLAGLALTHYRIVIFAACFFPAWFIFACKKSNWRSTTLRLASLTIIAFAIFTPWFIHVYGGKLFQSFTKQISVPSQLVSGQEISLQGDLLGFLRPTVWFVFALCIAWGLWRREKAIIIFDLWWFLVALVVNPQWLNLPGAGVLTNFALSIAVYIPASILLGVSIGWLIIHDRWSHSPLFHICLIILMVGMGIWGSRQRLRDLNISSGTLVTRPDLRAMAWIQTNTPQSSRFLVNSFQAYSNTVIVGSDAGWWIPLLAHRATSLPPLTYGSETGPKVDYVSWVNHLWVTLQQTGMNAPEAYVLLKEYGINYIYIGQRQGLVNNPGSPVLNPEQLKNNLHYQEVYHQDRVWIFKVKS